MDEILNILQDQHRVHGVVVFRGIAGFGSKGAVHSADLLRLMVDLPLVIEFYDTPAVAEAAMTLLRGLCPPATSFIGGRRVPTSRLPRDGVGALVMPRWIGGASRPSPAALP